MVDQVRSAIPQKRRKARKTAHLLAPSLANRRSQGVFDTMMGKHVGGGLLAIASPQPLVTSKYLLIYLET